MVSIIITWRDRKELKESLPSLVKTAKTLKGSVTIVNFDGSSEMLKPQISGYQDDIRIAHVEQEPFFNKSCAQNLGVFNTTHPIIFFCDCDIIVDEDMIVSLHNKLIENEDVFATIATVKETKPNSSELNHIINLGYDLYIKTNNGRELKIHYRGEDVENGIRMSPGLIMLRREDFIKIKGFNSSFEGWGWESQDFISRLILGAGLTRFNEGQAIHISHNEPSRIANAQNPDRWDNRDKMFRQAISNYNQGIFSGTYFDDINRVKSYVTNGYLKQIKE